MTAPSPAGLSPLLDQLDEARAKGTVGEWRIPHPFTKLIDGPERQIASAESAADAALIVAAVNALPQLTAAIRAVAERAEREVEDAEAGARYAAQVNQTVLLRSEEARAEAWRTVQRILAAALTPGADTAGATA